MSGPATADSEFTYELCVCRWAELAWPPGSDTQAGDDAAYLVARQLGTKHRRWDTVVVECDPDALQARAAFGDDEHDVETGLADEVWVATAETGATVEPALLEALPVEAGILTTDFAGGVDADAASVAWHPTSVTPTHGDDDRVSRRLELAERAYGRGWREYQATMRPDCRHFELQRSGRLLIPWCAAKECHQSSSVCSGSCAAFEPEPPTWRTNGWPIDGGPGAGIRRLLEQRAERTRQQR